MLTPCNPCLCPGTPCEHCLFGYQSKEQNHEKMRDIIIRVNNGNEKPGDNYLAERYKLLHPNWQEEMKEEPLC